MTGEPSTNGHGTAERAAGREVAQADREGASAAGTAELPQSVRERLEAVDVATMTPLEAMNTLAELSDRLE